MINIGAWVLMDRRTMFYIMIDEKKGKRFIWKVVLHKGKIKKKHTGKRKAPFIIFFLGKIQGRVGWGFEHPHLVEEFPARCQQVGLDGLLRSLPTQNNLQFHDSITGFKDTACQ